MQSCRAAERLRLQRGESRPQICPTVAGGLLTDCSPPLPCGRSGRGSTFSIPLPFPATQKGNVLQMSGKQCRNACMGGLQSLFRRINQQEMGVCECAGKFKSSCPVGTEHSTSPKTTCTVHCVRNTRSYIVIPQQSLEAAVMR